MNRKTFITSIIGIVAAPFTIKSEPGNKLPRERPVEVSDVEDFVRKEIDRRLKTTVNGSDLFVIFNRK
jgi:hypothetical protein